MYLFYASAFLELILDSVIIKTFLYNLCAFFSRYMLWYLDDSVVYMRDLILAHIWLLGLCSYKSGVTPGPPVKGVTAGGKGERQNLNRPSRGTGSNKTRIWTAWRARRGRGTSPSGIPLLGKGHPCPSPAGTSCPAVAEPTWIILAQARESTPEGSNVLQTV
jgi:hypothetical protein